MKAILHKWWRIDSQSVLLQRLTYQLEIVLSKSMASNILLSLIRLSQLTGLDVNLYKQAYNKLRIHDQKHP